MDGVEVRSRNRSITITRALMYSILSQIKESKDIRRYILDRLLLLFFSNFFHFGCSIGICIHFEKYTLYCYYLQLLLAITAITAIIACHLDYYFLFTMSEDFESLPPAVRRKVRVHSFPPSYPISLVSLTVTRSDFSHFPPPNSFPPQDHLNPIKPDLPVFSIFALSFVCPYSFIDCD